MVVGMGLNIHEDFGCLVVVWVSEQIGLLFSEVFNCFEVLVVWDVVVVVSGVLCSVVVSLIKIVNDICWLGLGLCCGIGEILLFVVQLGFFIMFGKVNLVMVELFLMVCVQVVGNDQVVVWGGVVGNFEFNVMKFLIVYNFL